MKSIILAATVAAALLGGASAASAAQFHTFTLPQADGSFTGTFGDNGIDAGVFSDTFGFVLPTGISSFTASSALTRVGGSTMNDINFTSITLNGANFNIGSTGNVEFRFLTGASVTNGLQQLVVSGTSGGNGSYAGTVAFTPAMGAVPEPASWALMILGFGSAGAMLRRRRSIAIAAA